MVAFVKCHEFGNHLLLGQHSLTADTVKCFLAQNGNAPINTTDTHRVAFKATPTAAEQCDFMITQYGYTAGGKDIVNTIAENTAGGGVWYVNCTDLTGTKKWTNSDGTNSWTTFQWVEVYNDSMVTATDNVDDGLIGWWDYGSGVTLTPSDTFSVTFTNGRVLSLDSNA